MRRDDVRNGRDAIDDSVSMERVEEKVGSRTDTRLGRPYWILWIATVVSQAGDWAQIVAQGVLVLYIGGNAAQVGLVSGMRILPQLAVTLAGGIVAIAGTKRSF